MTAFTATTWRSRPSARCTTGRFTSSATGLVSKWKPSCLFLQRVPSYLPSILLLPEPINTFQALQKSDKINTPVRLSYHRETHYNSLVDPFKASIGVGLGRKTSLTTQGNTIFILL